MNPDELFASKRKAVVWTVLGAHRHIELFIPTILLNILNFLNFKLRNYGGNVYLFEKPSLPSFSKHSPPQIS